MAKASGGTRSSGTSTGGMIEAPATGIKFIFDDEHYADTIAKGDRPYGWDELDTAQRELALMEGGFTGLASEDAEELMFEDTRDNLLGRLADDIVSDAQMYARADGVAVTVGYKDGSRRYFDTLNNDFEIGAVGRSSASGLYERAMKSMDRRHISYIIYSDGYDSRYWAGGSEGMKAIKAYTGYEKWTAGRGEKRRDYIQDDWI